MFKSSNFIKYILIGIVNTLIGFSLIFLFTYIGLLAEVSNFLGYIFGFLISFWLNKKYNFKTSGNTFSELSKFFKVVLFSYVINLIILFLLYRVYDINVYYSQLIAFLGYFFISYFLVKLYVFKRD